MPFRLVVEKRGKPTRAIEIRTGSARLGRARGNEVRIPSTEVSRRHCCLTMKNGVLWVEDLDSVNGTFLNGDLLTGESVVRPGDHLEVGPVTFVVEYELTPDALDRMRDEDYEILGESSEAIPLEVEEDEETAPQFQEANSPDLEPLDLPAKEEVLDVEEVVEDAALIPGIDLDAVTWATPDEGDLHDLLSHLDEGQESMLPRKRPRPRKPAGDDFPSDHRTGLQGPGKPKGKGGKRRPEADD